MHIKTISWFPTSHCSATSHSQALLFLWAWLLAPLPQMSTLKPASCQLIYFLFSVEDSPGWDGGRNNCFVNGYHDNRMNGAGNFNRGPPRNDRPGRGSFRGTRGGSTFNPPMHNTSKNLYPSNRKPSIYAHFYQMLKINLNSSCTIKPYFCSLQWL